MNAKANTEIAPHQPATTERDGSAGAVPLLSGVLTAVPSFGRLILPTARTLFWAILVLLAVQVASAVSLSVLADPALAQGVDGGSSGNIEGALTKFYDWLQTLMMLFAGIGFLVAAAFWAFAGSNDKRKSQGTGGMICALGAFAAAALVPDILAAIAEWTGAKG